VRPPRPLLEALCERALEDMRAAAAAAAAAAAEGQGQGQAAAPPHSGQAPATIMACLARLGYTPPDAWLVGFLTATQPQLRHYLPMDLVSLVHSCVSLSLSPGAAWMAEFYAVLKQRLIFSPTLSYGDFSRLMYSLGRIEYCPDQAWLQDFLELSRPKLARLRWGLGRTRLGWLGRRRASRSRDAGVPGGADAPLLLAAAQVPRAGGAHLGHELLGLPARRGLAGGLPAGGALAHGRLQAAGVRGALLALGALGALGVPARL
jgi:hypothetical protein